MIEEYIAKNNLPNYRLKQFNQQYYKNLIESWDELSTWPLDLREDIKKNIPFSTITFTQELVSKDKRTVKALGYTADGHAIEAVLMKTKSRNTVCVSCMSGCPVGCTFCATGQMGMNRNLSTEEILDQIMYFQRKLQKEDSSVTNIVYMGMGEPMLNLDNVVSSIKIITDEDKLAMSPRRITVSTSGYVKQLEKFLKLDLGVKIAISLHAPNQSIRESIMPNVAKNNHLDDLMKILVDFQKRTNKRITYEYLLLKDVNDTPEDAKELTKLLKNQIALVNLINFNPSEGIDFEPSHKKDIEIFQTILDERGITNTLRYSQGQDIKAACGQLARENQQS